MTTELSNEPAARVPCSLRLIERNGRLPLSFGQQRLWFLSQVLPDGTDYVVPLVLRLSGRLDADGLREALSAVAARHEVLRTRYAVRHGEPVQLIDPPGPAPLTVVAADEDGLPELVREVVEQPFDLGRGPVWRARLVRLADDEHALIVAVHQIACDDRSADLLRREVMELYRGGCDLPGPDVQYADFAVWQRERLGGPALQEELDRWLSRLDGVRPLDLPTDRPPVEPRDPRAARCAFDVPSDLTSAVVELSRRIGVTPYVTLLAAFTLLLAKTTGRRDFTIGASRTGRCVPEVERTIGLFANPAVLRCRLTGDPTFAALLDRMRTAVLDAADDMPFGGLVRALGDQGRFLGPIVNVVFDMADRVAAPAPRDGLRVTEVPVARPAVPADLTLALRDRDGRLTGGFEYATALFDEPTVRGFADRYLALLAAVIAEPDARISRLSQLTEADVVRLADWNATAAPVPDLSVPALIERTAAAAPDAVAAVSDGRRLTYAELTGGANRLARELRARGVARGSVVAVCLRPDVDLVVTVLAILKAGAAFLPVDPGFPAARIGYLLEDTGVAAVVTTGDLAGLFAGAGRPLVFLDRDRDAIAARPAGPLPAAATPDDLAYVLYTSGSTGRPKGVLIPHRGVVNLVTAFQRRYPLTARDRVLQKSPFTFDAFIRDVFWPLSAGALVVIAPADLHLDALALADFAEAHDITHMHFVPSLLDAFLDVTAAFPERCREVFCGGEVLRAATVRRLRERSDASVHNMYGPTEITVNAAVHDVEPAPAADPLAIGGPLDNVQVHVLDEELNPVPVGVPGEIYLGGAGLAWGYLGRPALTAGWFVADPVAADGTRLFRTGDRGRRRADGRLEFLGRKDAQVKVRGVRIEPGEIEAALTEHPAVLAAAAGAHWLPDGDALLVAYVVPASGQDVDAAVLRAHLAAHLPDHLIPNHFVALERLPLTASGKLDRRALPPPHVDDRRCAPFSQLCAEDRGRLPAGLADAYPMTQTQIAMLFEMLADDEVHPYHNVISYPVHDDADFSAEALRTAAHAVAMRHDVLRTSFDVTTFSEPLQLVHRTATPDVAVDDLRGLTDGEQRTALVRALGRERSELFDTDRAPLWRLTVHQMDDRRWWLTVVGCHSILDGWSRQALLTELLDHYRTVRDKGCAPSAPPPPVRFADFVAAERDSLVGQRHRRFWLDRLSRHARFALPEDWADPICADRKVAWCFPTEHLDAGLRRLAEEAGASLKAVYLAGYLAVLSAHTAETGFYIGVASDGRLETSGGDAVCGMHLNTVPFVAEPGSATTWRRLVADTFAEEVASRPHRRYPLPELSRELCFGASLIQAHFSYFEARDGELQGVDLRQTVDDSPTEFPLAVTVTNGRVEVNARSSRVSAAQARVVGEEYLAVLRAMAADPDATPGGVPARPAHTGVAPLGGLERTIAGVWAEQLGVAQVDPDDDFVVLGGHSLTAMRVAARLRADHGVHVSPRDVLRHRTVAALVAAIEAAEGDAATDVERGSLVWFRRSGTRPTLFCVHDTATHPFAPLAAALGPDQPVAALQDPATVEPDRAGAAIEDLAALYAADLRAAAPDGPYPILAWCAGAPVGWELARRLAGAGARPVLYLLDATLAEPAGKARAEASRVDLLRTCEELFGRLRADPDGERTRTDILGMLHFLYPDETQDMRPEDVEHGWPEIVRVRRAQAEARQAYRYEPFSGPVHLLVGDEVVERPVFYGDVASYDDYLAGWRRLAPGGLRVHRVQGQHAEVLRPPLVDRFAAALVDILAP